MGKLPVILLLVAAGAGNAVASVTNCDNVLLAKNVSSIKENRQTFSAWLSMINQNNYSENKSRYALDVPGYFNGDYADFSRHRERFQREEGSAFQSGQARSVLSSALPDDAIAAWRSCVVAHVNGVYAYPIRADRDNAKVVIGWRRSPGGAPVEALTIIVNGRELKHDIPAGFEGEQTIAIVRTGQALNGAVNVRAGSGAYTADFHVPVYESPLPPLACGAGSKRIEARNGNGALAQITVPPSRCDRYVRATAIAGAVYETPGDPWVKVRLVSGGMPPAEDYRGVTVEGVTTARVSREVFVPAGQEVVFTASHENFHARAVETTVWAEVPTP